MDVPYLIKGHYRGTPLEKRCVSIKTSVSECSTYSSFIIKDYGAFQKQIYFKTSIKKKGFEENEDSIKKSDFELYVDENEFSKEGLDLLLKPEKDIRWRDEDNKARAIRRAKQKIYDISFLNRWDYFVTLTFDKEKVGNRYDLDGLKKKTLETFKQWTKKYGIKYLLVPELHKDGALHWHGFLQDSNNSLTMSTTNKFTKNGGEVFNINSWANYKGYNTAVKINQDLISRQKISSYISKYITKEDRLFNKYYYCSNGLVDAPKTIYLDTVPIDFFLGEGDIYENAQCYIKTVKKNKNDE